MSQRSVFFNRRFTHAHGHTPGCPTAVSPKTSKFTTTKVPKHWNPKLSQQKRYLVLSTACAGKTTVTKIFKVPHSPGQVQSKDQGSVRDASPWMTNFLKNLRNLTTNVSCLCAKKRTESACTWAKPQIRGKSNNDFLLNGILFLNVWDRSENHLPQLGGLKVKLSPTYNGMGRQKGQKTSESTSLRSRYGPNIRSMPLQKSLLPQIDLTPPLLLLRVPWYGRSQSRSDPNHHPSLRA